jgi:hypothetical protein
MLSPSCWDQHWASARHVLLLVWVKDYQTLVAGVLAFAAGTFVYTSVTLKIRHQEKSGAAEQNQCAAQVLHRFTYRFYVRIHHY